MSNCYLSCNIVNCRKELKTQAWVTLCSHIFCLNHGQVSVDKEKCLVCENPFSNKYDIVVTDLNPNEQHKTMVLAGLSPEKIIDIANRSLTFWTYQIYQERLLRDSEVRSAKQHSAELADYCESMIAKHKLEVQKLLRENQCYQKEIDDKTKQLEDFAMQSADKSKLIKNLQGQNDSLKRSLANYMRSHEKYNNQHVDNVEQDVIRSYSSNYLYHKPNHEERQNLGRYSSEIKNKEFVFKPVTVPTPNYSDSYKFK